MSGEAAVLLGHRLARTVDSWRAPRIPAGSPEFVVAHGFIPKQHAGGYQLLTEEPIAEEFRAQRFVLGEKLHHVRTRSMCRTAGVRPRSCVGAGFTCSPG